MCHARSRLTDWCLICSKLAQRAPAAAYCLVLDTQPCRCLTGKLLGAGLQARAAAQPDEAVSLLSCWVQDYKYVWLAANSTFKADSDLSKYEKARKLKVRTCQQTVRQGSTGQPAV